MIPHVPEAISAHEKRLGELAGLIVGPSNQPTLLVQIEHTAGPRERYKLTIGHRGIRVRASTSLGTLHAMRTLVDLWDAGDGTTLPHIEIEDWPTFDVRGVFVESFAGTDRMTLADWQQFLDRMGQLKFNTVGVSIYGCWDIHHEGTPSEYLFTPLDDFPELETPRRMVTWDPETECEVEQIETPTMFGLDLFADVARYAADQGIELIPHLGGPGHSTLIPRLVPELSALDVDNRPTGYGYCVSRPSAREALGRLVRNLARQHLEPTQITRLHVAADEYYPIRNVDPQDRTRIVSPYCRCTGCRELTPGQLLMEYLVQVGTVLSEYGISMVHWHDTLVREGVLDEYLDRIEALGLPSPAIAWWKYNDPVPVPDSPRAETWSCPTTGFTPFLFYQDFSPNIETVLRRGHVVGTTGVFAYGQPDPAYHMTYAFLADMAWNLEAAGGTESFRQRWAERLYLDQVDAAHYALSSASTITASYPLMMYVVQHLLPFFSTASGGATEYPDDLLRAFSLTQPPLADVLRQVADTLRDAVSLMPSGREVRYWPNPTEVWRAEHMRLVHTLELFLHILDATRQSTPLTDADLDRLRYEGLALLRSVAANKPAYLAPATLREHWILIRDIDATLHRLQRVGGVADAESWYAWLV